MITAVIYATILLGVVAFCFLVAGTFRATEDAPYPQTFESLDAQLDKLEPTRRHRYQYDGQWFVVETFVTPWGDVYARTREA
jgi:hypothetical protein